MKKATPKFVIIMICLVLLVVGFYAYLANKEKEAKQETKLTAVQETLSRDMEHYYPSTPKEVIKYYNQIMKCFYNENCTEEEIDALGQRARDLYDAELLEANELGTYMMQLRADIKEYKEKKRIITNATVAASTSVDFFEEDGFSFARIVCIYNILEGDTNKPTKQVYLLRKDEELRWKIYGWMDAAFLEENQQQNALEAE